MRTGKPGSSAYLRSSCEPLALNTSVPSASVRIWPCGLSVVPAGAGTLTGSDQVFPSSSDRIISIHRLCSSTPTSLGAKPSTMPYPRTRCPSADLPRVGFRTSISRSASPCTATR